MGEDRDKGLASVLFVRPLLRINEVIHVASVCAARHSGAEKGRDDTPYAVQILGVRTKVRGRGNWGQVDGMVL